mgnify:CR=1 FL=1
MNLLRTSLWSRLTVAFVFVALIGVTLVAVLANRATSVGFQRYLQAGEIASFGDLQQDLAATVRWYLDHREWCAAVQSGSYRRERLGLGTQS